MVEVSVTETLIFVQIVLLYLLTTQLSKIQSQLRLVLASAAVASLPRASASSLPPPHGAASPRSPCAASVNPVSLHQRRGVPTIETLLPDAPKKDFQPENEWGLLSPAELAVARKVRSWLGAERFSEVPCDLLVTFIRGYAYRTDWAESTYVYLERALSWRRELGIDNILLNEPPNRRLFEEVCPAGPVGYDAEGHLVICERLGQTDVARLFANFDEDTYIMHSAFSREAVR